MTRSLARPLRTWAAVALLMMLVAALWVGPAAAQTTTDCYPIPEGGCPGIGGGEPGVPPAPVGQVEEAVSVTSVQGELPRGGAQLATLAAVALIGVGAGAGVLLVSRRRREA